MQQTSSSVVWPTKYTNLFEQAHRPQLQFFTSSINSSAREIVSFIGIVISAALALRNCHVTELKDVSSVARGKQPSERFYLQPHEREFSLK
jgi:hypothetical protein